MCWVRKEGKEVERVGRGNDLIQNGKRVLTGEGGEADGMGCVMGVDVGEGVGVSGLWACQVRVLVRTVRGSTLEIVRGNGEQGLAGCDGDGEGEFGNFDFL